MGEFAKKTEVSPEKTRAEIESVLRRYGATSFFYGWQNGQAVLGFRAFNRLIQFTMALPERDAREFTHTPAKGQRRSAEQATEAWEQAVRQRWRALLLGLKAKLEWVESGITTFEREFLPWTVLPDGRTVGEAIAPLIEDAYRTGEMPPLLPFRKEA